MNFVANTQLLNKYLVFKSDEAKMDIKPRIRNVTNEKIQ